MTLEFLAIIALCLVLGVVLAGYDKLLRKFKAVKSSQEEIEARARDNAVKIVQEAKDKAVLILNEVNLKAGMNQQELENKLAEVAEKQSAVYKDMLQNITNKIESEAVGEISQFKRAIDSETIDAEKDVSQKISMELAEAEKQILEYKANKMREFDSKAEVLLKEYLKLMTGKIFNSNEIQIETIKQAIIEAKEHNVF